ncbi:MAG: hydrolase [Gemmatimonadetes bacterium]|nr:hydrolase [Gemmatimonadota bacterium]
MSLIRREDALLLIIDVQERLVPVMHEAEELVRRCETLIEIAKTLGLPIVATEQYPRGLGPTMPALAEKLGGATVLSKLSFSAMGDAGVRDTLRAADRSTLVIAGIESHVCVLQSAVDAVDRGFQVQVVADAISSRRPESREIAMHRIQAAGATITTIESVAFECLKVAGSDEFRAVSRLIR